MTEELPTPTRVCSQCAALSQAPGEFCPHCGKPYAKGASNKQVLLRVGIGVVAVLLVAGVGTAVVVNQNQQAAEDREVQASASAAAAASAAAEQAAAEQAAAEQAAAEQDAADDAERARRAGAVTELERSVEKDAKKDVKAGILTGPIISVSCTATGGGSTDDLDAPSTKYECFAANKDNGDGTLRGYPYDATIDWSDNSYTWILAT